MKKAIVTGGSSGLGLAIARELVKNNVQTIILARTNEDLQRVNKEIQNSLLTTYQCNVGNEKEVLNFFKDIESKSFSPTLLFNVAGVGKFGDPKENTSEMITTVFEASLIGMILMCSNFLKSINEESSNLIVNVMSTAALVGRPLESVYCAAKWGARGFTESLKVYLKGSSTKIMAVFPGGINSPFWIDSGMSPNLETFMQPEHVAKKIVFSSLNVDSSYVMDITINRI